LRPTREGEGGIEAFASSGNVQPTATAVKRPIIETRPCIPDPGEPSSLAPVRKSTYGDRTAEARRRGPKVADPQPRLHSPQAMQLYSGLSTDFIRDSVHNRIAEKLKDAFFRQFRFHPAPSEVNSWRNSLRAVSQVLDDAKLHDHGILLEYPAFQAGRKHRAPPLRFPSETPRRSGCHTPGWISRMFSTSFSRNHRGRALHCHDGGVGMGRNERAARLGYNSEMKRGIDDLLREALKLPPEARAALAGSLIDSLDGKSDDDVETAWDAEIARRLQEMKEGQVALVPWTEVRRRLIGQ
jgi:putative addiction module component (TIGR02574 family)